jgi:ribose-phosphate pyrophosphokinase
MSENLHKEHSKDAIRVFSGNSNLPLAKDVCAKLNVPLSQADIRRFSDGEINVDIQANVRGSDVFVIQSTSTPTNDHLMELLLMLDALKRASAKRVTAVVPYYGYARQDRKVAPRAPISAKLIADLLQVAGAGRLLTMDLHAGQIQGFFDGPVDNLYATPVLLQYLRDRLNGTKATIISPDAGGVERARAYAKRLDASLAVIDKRRSGPNTIAEMNIIGDVGSRTAILVDDMVDTAGTLTTAAQAAVDAGAGEVLAACSHAVLSGPAIERLEKSQITELIVTDTIDLRPEAKACTKVKVLSVAELIGEGIRRTHNEESVSSLFI